MLTVSVENFGPIREGTVELRPLTVFVGANNSGKSYMATLIYAVSRALSLDSIWDVPWLRRPYLRRFRGHGFDISERALAMLEDAEAGRAIRAWLTSRFVRGNRRSSRAEMIDICYTDLPMPLQQALQIVVEDYLDSLAESLSGEIERCFGTKISDLSSNLAPVKSFTLSVVSTETMFELKLKLSGRKLIVSDKKVELSSAKYKIYSRDTLRYFDVDEEGRRPSLQLFEFLSESAVQIMGEVIWPTYYLPASRSGTLQSHKALASSFVRQSPLVGIEELDVPRITGVIADFISNILTLDSEQKATGIIRRVASFLESEVVHGSISLSEGGKLLYPEIYYTRDGERFELHRTSSMVSELAPIILFIRHLTRPGSLLIVEEPESHLHPAAQRPLARAFARLLGQGVGLLLTTHSDYFIQQLSHLMQLGALSPEQRGRLGYGDEDVIPVSSVGAYLFDTSGPVPGNVVEELSVEDSDGIPGIPDDQYADVSEALYNEMVNLERAAARNESRTE